jgi:hypothetical protein
MGDRNAWVVGLDAVLPCGCTALDMVPARQHPDGTWEWIAATEVDLVRHVANRYQVTRTGELRRLAPVFVDGVRVFCPHGEVRGQVVTREGPREHDPACAYASGVPHDGPCVRFLRRVRP